MRRATARPTADGQAVATTRTSTWRGKKRSRPKRGSCRESSDKKRAEKEDNAKFSQIKDLRKIYFTNSEKYGVFSRKDSWNLFKNEFDFVKLEKINLQPELDLVKIKKKYNMDEDHKALEKKDKLWSNKSAKNVRQALNRTDNKISYTNQDEEAHVYLEDALNKLLHLVEKDSFLLSKRDLTFKRGVIRTLQSKDQNENKENADRIRLIAEAIKREL